MCISRQCKCCCCVSSTNWINNRNRKSNHKLNKHNGFKLVNRSSTQSTTSSSSSSSLTLLWLTSLTKYIQLSVSEVLCKLKSTFRSSSSPQLTVNQLDNQRNYNNLTRLYGILILITFIVYANSIPGDFVHDDIEAIVRNPDVIGTNNWSSLWFNDFWGRPMSDPLSHKSYRPLTILTFRLNMMLKGGAGLSSISWHFRLVNVTLHVITVNLIMYISSSILNCTNSMSLLVSLHFAVHPIHTEAVSSNVGRADILCCIFSLITLITFTRSLRFMLEDRNNRQMVLYLFGSCLSATLALLSKETGITILPICILYYLFKLSQSGSLTITRNGINLSCCNQNDGNLSSSIYYTENKSNYSSSSSSSSSSSRSSSPTPSTSSSTSTTSSSSSSSSNPWLCGPILIPMIMTLALLWFRISMLHGTLPIFSRQDNPASFSNSMLTRFLTYSYLCAFNCQLLLYPLRLSYDWQLGSIPLITTLSDTRNVATLVTFLCTIGVTIISGKFILTQCCDDKVSRSEVRRRRRDIIFDKLTCNNRKSLMKQSSTYLMMYTPSPTPSPPPTPSLPLTNVNIMNQVDYRLNLHEVTFMGLCFMVLPYLPASNLLVTVGFVVAERILYLPSVGFSLLIIAGYDLIKRRITSDSRFNQFNCSKWLTVGFHGLLIVFTMKTITQNSLWQNRASLFTAGLLAVPENAKMHYNYANLQKDIGNNEAAVHHYREALRLWPTHESSWNNLATLLNDPEEAEYHLIQALKINPYHPKAHFNLACIYSKKGLTSQAINLLQRSIELDSNFAEPYSSLAAIYAEQGLHGYAQLLHEKSLKLLSERRTFSSSIYRNLLHTLRG